jgi:hypothetical protein
MFKQQNKNAFLKGKDTKYPTSLLLEHDFSNCGQIQAVKVKVKAVCGPYSTAAF